jgi:hypothetical protein
LTNRDVRVFAVSGTNLFAGTYYGGVFLSTNKGISWMAVNTGLPYDSITHTILPILSLALSDSNLFAGTL